MRGAVSTARGRGACGLALLGAMALLIGWTPRAYAIDLLEGRVQLHGYIEEQIRGISANYNQQFDMTQWYTVLRIESDISLIQNPIGPLDSLRSYIALQGQYDCVWTRACGLFPNVDVYGDRAAKLPDRLANAKLPTNDGVIQVLPPTQLLIGNRPGGLDEVIGFNGLFAQTGPSLVFEGPDAPAQYTFKDFLDYKFAQRRVAGQLDGIFIGVLGPWLPKNQVNSVATLGTIANPFAATDFNPIIPNPTNATPPCNPGNLVHLPGLGGCGSGAKAFRPAPTVANTSREASNFIAHGIYYPSPGLVNYLSNGRPGTTDMNFSQSQLSWDHGASQSETYEVREAYLHAEFLDGRAWVRLGKQLIVWGKTELFAVTDQFNPRDEALSSLPTLEESRIPVFALRSVYNFYTVGPFEDVRLEGALNLDRFTPDDLGKCGEPYAVNAVCDKAYGLFAHGLTGVGVAGETRPDEWWQSTQGLQGGMRLEFRWDRYSFALSDQYNYVRIPNINQINSYGRNVDPSTGMPRANGASGPCQFGGVVGGNAIRIGSSCLTPQTALQQQSENQQLFAMICSTTVGISPLDRTACAQSVLGSTNSLPPPAPLVPVSVILSFLFAGNPAINAGAFGAFGAPQPIPFVTLNSPSGAPLVNPSLPNTLTVQQQALLGCGAFFNNNCTTGGIDLLNMEASAVTQSFPGFDGTSGPWFLNNKAVAQPGTVNFVGGPKCTRYAGGATTVQVVGCRGPGDPGYNPAVDGTPGGIKFVAFPGLPPALIAVLNAEYAANGQPETGQPFQNVMAGFSWNLLMILVVTSPNWDHQPLSNASKTSCSYIRADLCTAVQGFMTVTGTQRNTLNAGGNGRFGRRDFVWASGGEVNLQYQKRNVLGFSMDFAEDVTKSNWGIEMGWERHLPFPDNNSLDNLSRSDDIELSISVDRPTFINFLNQNRTFFFNTQIFLSYLTNYHTSYTIPGPFGVLGTFTISTGYFQDRLLPSVTFVYDVFSNSGAALPGIQYRFTENFSFTLGIAQFLGRFRTQAMPVNPVATVQQNYGKNAYDTYSEPGLSLIRDRDEAYMRIRYTF